jgi:N-ethylmaleimide reductase
MPTYLTLLSPVQVGALALRNRVVMAPMTRNRSHDGVPGPLVPAYYAQRAEAGLIITEGTAPHPNGLGYARIPGIYTAEQVAAWRPVTDGVHALDSRIAVQLMHTGRIGHPLNLPAGARLVGPSAVAAPGEIFTDQQGMQPHPVPEAMTEQDIETALQSYEDAAAHAITAGFDAVELHGANGYLIDQFLNLGANQRTDAWGGTIEGRIRFAVEAARRTAARIGADRVGFRVSPYGVYNGMQPDPDMHALYAQLTSALSELGLAWIHTVDHSSMGAPAPDPATFAEIRTRFKGTYILSGGYDAARAEADLAAGKGNVVAFGRPFISNPHLVSRFTSGTAMTPPDFSTFYTPGEKGYTDYPLD